MPVKRIILTHEYNPGITILRINVIDKKQTAAGAVPEPSHYKLKK
jgi:hypothetical protein